MSNKPYIPQLKITKPAQKTPYLYRGFYLFISLLALTSGEIPLAGKHRTGFYEVPNL